ncbi:MAG: arginine--tRNA ligase [bacterium]
MKEKLETLLRDALTNLGIMAETIVLEHPAELSHGDYSTSVALAYAKKIANPPAGGPRALAEKIVAELSSEKLAELGIEKMDIAGAGFINFHLSKDFFAKEIETINTLGSKWGTNSASRGKKVMVEYTDPNPFKPFHIGHLMTNAIGESTARIFEYSGANVVRANYQGDVGLHVAKAIWCLLKKGKGDTSLSVQAQAEYIGACYVEGSTAYEENPDAKIEIDAINKKVYEKADPAINDMYDWGRKVTLEAFETIYALLGTKFQSNCYFFESVMAPIGKKIVQENTGTVFEESDGAIVFKAEKYNPKLHTRVFINSQGLPTYETKEIGLTVTKFEQENPDLSIVVTAIEQGPYMSVVQKAISLIHPDYESRMKHLTHGMMRFASGKMSSRKGNVITGESLLQDARDLVHEKIKEREYEENERDSIAAQVSVAAIKYTILKQQLGGNIIYDEEHSVSFEGDSGPYLQYTAVRAQSIHEKGKNAGLVSSAVLPAEWKTTSLEKYLYRFPEVVERSYQFLEPHHIAGYLLELAAQFNSFYGQEKIVDSTDATSPYKLALTEAFRTTMKNGLYLLGIEIPNKM